MYSLACSRTISSPPASSRDLVGDTDGDFLPPKGRTTLPERENRYTLPEQRENLH